MPLVLPDHLTRFSLIIGPQLPVPMIVKKDGLKDVTVEVHVRRDLSLVVCAVEAHL
jgi:hypothetical protein